MFHRVVFAGSIACTSMYGVCRSDIILNTVFGVSVGTCYCFLDNRDNWFEDHDIQIFVISILFIGLVRRPDRPGR